MHVSSTNRPGLSGSGRMVADPDITPFSGYVRVGGDPPATREDVQNDLRKCLDEWAGDFTSTRILNVGVGFIHVRTTAIPKRDRPSHFSGRRLEMNNDIWPATGGSIFASTITTYPGTGHISRSPFMPIEPPLWPKQ
jgi:hypothetical protein